MQRFSVLALFGRGAMFACKATARYFPLPAAPYPPFLGQPFPQQLAQRAFLDPGGGQHTIVEPLELAHSATQALLRGQTARPARAAQDENAQPLRKRAHGAAHAGLDDEVALDASLLLAFDDREQRGAILCLGHSRPPARPGALKSARPAVSGSRSKLLDAGG